MSIERLEQAGFVDLQGSLGRPVPSVEIVVPTEVWVEGDEIHWHGDRVRYREVSRTMLNQFVRLTHAESILRFAKQWGVLALSGIKVLRPGHGELSGGSEPIAAWQYYSRRAAAVLNIAAALKEDKLGDLKDWAEIGQFVQVGDVKSSDLALVRTAMEHHRFGMSYHVFALYGKIRLDDARRHIASEVQVWLDCWKAESAHGFSDFGLQWNDEEQRWNIQIDYHGFLFAAIALQLALVVADADSLYCCSGCGLPYVRPRQRKRPRSGWANYCGECSKEGVAGRKAVETYRGKRATALRMHLDKIPLDRIAKQIDTPVERVRKWVAKGGKHAVPSRPVRKSPRANRKQGNDDVN